MLCAPCPLPTRCAGNKQPLFLCADDINLLVTAVCFLWGRSRMFQSSSAALLRVWALLLLCQPANIILMSRYEKNRWDRRNVSEVLVHRFHIHRRVSMFDISTFRDWFRRVWMTPRDWLFGFCLSVCIPQVTRSSVSCLSLSEAECFMELDSRLIIYFLLIIIFPPPHLPQPLQSFVDLGFQ